MDHVSICLGIEAFSKLEPELRQAALDMARIILESKEEDERQMSVNTLDDILFPPKDTLEEVETKLATLPFEHRLRWCESSGPCACMGCANRCGISKSEWRRWGKRRGYKVSKWGNQFEGHPQAGDVKDPHAFVVRLSNVPSDKLLAVAKAIHAHSKEFTLQDSLKIAKSAPTIVYNELYKAFAIKFKETVEAAGAEVELAPVTY